MLDKNNFIDFLNNPQSLSLNDIMLMENMTKKYPYFQLGYTMIAKGIYTKAPEIAHDAIRKAAIYALSRNALRKVIENDIDWNANITARLIDTPIEVKFSPDSIEEELNREKLEEELIESIAKPALRNIQEEQLALIEQFIKKEPRIQPIRTNITSEEVEDLSERSTTMKGPLLTESYAKILSRQGRFEQAIEVYHKLIAKNPEKSTYFAEKIVELEKKILL
jgi:tetratricopeptide (TPR) repeat protein